MGRKAINVDSLLENHQAVLPDQDLEASVSASLGYRKHLEKAKKGKAPAVKLSAIRTRAEGQVRLAEIQSAPDFKELVDSIKEHGVLTPVALSYDPHEDCFWIDYGHRRVAASRAAGQNSVPATIQLDGQAHRSPKLTQHQLIENLQRSDLPTVDVALAIKELVEAGINNSTIAKKIGKSPAWVSQYVKIGQLDRGVLHAAAQEGLGHRDLYAIASKADTAQAQSLLMQTVIGQGRSAITDRPAAKTATTPKPKRGRPSDDLTVKKAKMIQKVRRALAQALEILDKKDTEFAAIKDAFEALRN